jgi:hypothetical protein
MVSAFHGVQEAKCCEVFWHSQQQHTELEFRTDRGTVRIHSGYESLGNLNVLSGRHSRLLPTTLKLSAVQGSSTKRA